MTPRQRVAHALTHQETDFCPYDVQFDEPLRQRLADLTADPHFGRHLVRHLASVGPAYPETNQRLDDHHYTDAFGVVWQDSFPGEIGMVRDPILKEPTLSGYDFPPATLPGLFDGLPDQIAACADAYVTWGIGFSLYERAWTLRGIENFLLDMVERPRFAHQLLDRICEFNLALLQAAAPHPFDCVRFGDDWGAQHGLIMGPQLWRLFIKPRLARMIEKAASFGKTTFVHSDGDVSEIIPDLIEIGLTVLNPLQPDVMDIYHIKREYGRHLAFHGGVSVQHLLPDSSPDQLRAELRRLFRHLGAGGGLILAPTHSLGQDIPLENLVVLAEECLRQQSTD